MAKPIQTGVVHSVEVLFTTSSATAFYRTRRQLRDILSSYSQKFGFLSFVIRHLCNFQQTYTTMDACKSARIAPTVAWCVPSKEPPQLPAWRVYQHKLQYMLNTSVFMLLQLRGTF